MSFKIKSYDPVPHQQRAEQRRQKQSAQRLKLAPTNSTRVGGPPSQFPVASHKHSRADKEFIPPSITNRDQNPYPNYPTEDEMLEFCSPSSGNSLSCIDSAIDIQDASWDPSYQNYGYKDDELKQKLPAAIATMPLTSELNVEREACNVNTSASTTVSEEGSNTEISPAEHTWSPDTKTTPSNASSISSPQATSPRCQKETWRNQESFVDNEVGAQESCTRMPDLGRFNVTSKDALSGEGVPVLQCQNNTAPELLSSDSSSRLLSQNIQASRVLASAASTREGSVMELSSAKRTPAQDAASSSTKRSFSESDATSDSQPSSSEAYHSPKRQRFTSISSEEAVSTLLDIQKMILNVLAKLNQDQPHSLIPDVSAQSISDTIQVAVNEVGHDSSDDSSGIGSNLDDSDSETELAAPPQNLQYRSTQRRRWTTGEEKLLRRLKSTQKRNGIPSDCDIASKLDRTESGVKQHWDVMLQKSRRKY
ncbi:hypothetical protein FOVG_16996 [Fusarium oxysporum f. sp. pisi HDV247]|uniref:Myb-like domain-containing protein n=1 Tax=Fusarium oxysporum f. sp. pisi HDV247 TaxID=1080344 RepID=W9NGE2_FUSOX|nr:hypothetical protein FOVG_16996 [Fusarium oxysporum f. sp. pisi HDV247]